MKKIIFCDLPIQQISPVVYEGTESIKIDFGKKSRFPIIPYLATILKKDDNVKIVMSKVKTSHGTENENEKEFNNEINSLRELTGANIEMVLIETSFDETQSVHEKRYIEMLEALEDDCEVYADATYGPKSVPMITINVLNFAEKFFNADIKKIIYGKVEFPPKILDEKTGKYIAPQPEKGEISNVTSLYYLNSIADNIFAENGQAAIKSIKEILSV